MSDQKQVVNALENLIEVCRDAQSGYREGSERVRNPELKSLLNELSLERAKFAGDLETEVVRYGKGNVDRSGSALGALRRGWTGLKASLGGGDEAILASMEAAEDFAKRRYDRYIIDERLPEDLRGTIRNQAQVIVGTIDRIRAMRRKHKAA
jgi:uncharacterized protein (TIGR02284 family)